MVSEVGEQLCALHSHKSIRHTYNIATLVSERKIGMTLSHSTGWGIRPIPGHYMSVTPFPLIDSTALIDHIVNSSPKQVAIPRSILMLGRKKEGETVPYYFNELPDVVSNIIATGSEAA